jgi:large subunit ribosomal protein L9
VVSSACIVVAVERNLPAWLWVTYAGCWCIARDGAPRGLGVRGQLAARRCARAVAEACGLPDGQKSQQRQIEDTTMEVILLQKVANLGNIGDKVKVKPGYGRNFLLPSGKAALATATNLKKFEERRSELEKLAADSLSSAQSRAKQLEGFKLALQAKAGTEGKLFGSVGTSDIAEALTRGGIAIERAEVRLPGGPIRLLGEHHVKLHLHTDVEIDLR